MGLGKLYGAWKAVCGLESCMGFGKLYGAWKAVWGLESCMGLGKLYGAWKAIRDRLRRPYSLGKFAHVRKIREKKQGMDIGKCTSVNRTIRTGSNYLQKRYGLSVLNLRFLEREFGK